MRQVLGVAVVQLEGVHQCFAGRQTHTSACGWCFLAPLIPLLLAVMVYLNPGEETLPEDSGCYFRFCASLVQLPISVLARNTSSSDSGLLVRSHIYNSPCNGDVSDNLTSEEGPVPHYPWVKEGLTTCRWFPAINMGPSWCWWTPCRRLFTMSTMLLWMRRSCCDVCPA